MPQSVNAIEISGLCKSFGAKRAVDGLDLVVSAGELCGFIGPNGAGKTTTIRMVLSILFPDAGRLAVLGKESALESRDQIGYLPEERGLYRKMRVAELLQYVGRLKGLRGPGLRGRVADWLERVGLADCARKRCEELSKGMQQKVQFVATVLHQPDLLILDEPFSGLDPVNMRLLRDLFLAEHARGCTIVFSTHVMHQAEQLCERIVMLHRGRKVLDGSLAALRAQHAPSAVVFEPSLPGADPAPLAALEGVTSVRPRDGAYELGLEDGADPAAVIRQATAAVPAARVEVLRPSLEDIFVATVAEGDEAALRAALRDEEGAP